MPQTVKLNSKSVNFSPFPSIAPFSWGTTSLTFIEAQNRLSLPESFPWVGSSCADEPAETS